MHLVNIKPRLQKVDWWQFGSKRLVFWLVIGLPSETGYFSPSWDIQPERVLASIGQPQKKVMSKLQNIQTLDIFKLKLSYTCF